MSIVLIIYTIYIQFLKKLKYYQFIQIMIILVLNKMTTLYDINSKIFDVFGKKYMNENKFNSRLINGLSLSKNYENLFRDECFKILNGNSSDVNQVKLLFLIQNIIQHGYDFTVNLIINIYNDFMLQISEELQNEMNNKTFTISYFLNKYENINHVSMILTKSLNQIDKNIYSDSKFNFSTILLIKSYIFYRVVLNKLYDYEGVQYYIYEIFSQIVQESQKMDELSKLFKIIQQYNRLSFVVKNEREKYFNIDMNNKFTLKSGEASNKLLDMINRTMNDQIKSLLTITDIKYAEQKLKEIRDLINMGSNVTDDKTIFILMYRANLIERLLSGQSNAEIENELLTSINYNDNPDIYAKIKYQISDVNLSKAYTEYFKKINVQAQSEKYKNYDLSKMNKNIANFIVARSYAWDLKNDEPLNIPVELSAYFDIFNAYYKSQYPDRELNCQYDKSTAEIKMEFGDKTYNIHMTLLQLIVITLINNSGTISARNISVQLGMPLKRLEDILNSLIIAKLINREDGPANNPNLLFTINQNCSFPEESISLISLIKKTQELRSLQQISDTVLKAEILSYLADEGKHNFTSSVEKNDTSLSSIESTNKSTNELNLKSIHTFLENKLKVKFQETKLLDILNQQIKSNIVIINNADKYSLNNDLDDIDE